MNCSVEFLQHSPVLHLSSEKAQSTNSVPAPGWALGTERVRLGPCLACQDCPSSGAVNSEPTSSAHDGTGAISKEAWGWRTATRHRCPQDQPGGQGRLPDKEQVEILSPAFSPTAGPAEMSPPSGNLIPSIHSSHLTLNGHLTLIHSANTDRG